MIKSTSATLLTLAMLTISAQATRAGELTIAHEESALTSENEISAEIDLSIGEFTVKAAPSDKAAVIDGEYDERRYEYRYEYHNRSDVGDLYFQLEGRDDHRRRSSSKSNSRWDIGLTDKVPVDLKMDIGAAECNLELGGMMISGLNLDVGAADFTATFDSPNKCTLDRFTVDAGASSLEITNLGNARFRMLKFEGGVGSYELDFSGQFDFEAEAEISVGMGSIEIAVPHDIGVRIYSDEGFMSSVDLPKRAFKEVDDGEYESKNWDEAKGHLTITLDIGMGSADIEFTR